MRALRVPGVADGVTASFGVAALGRDSTEALLQEADDALYRAKAAGRDRVVVAGGRDAA